MDKEIKIITSVIIEILNNIEYISQQPKTKNLYDTLKLCKKVGFSRETTMTILYKKGYITKENWKELVL
jgi:hypothetical protein